MTDVTVIDSSAMTVIVCLFVLAGTAAPVVGQEADPAGRVPVEVIRESARQVMERTDFRSVRRRVLEQVPVRDLDRGFLKGLIGSIGRGIADLLSWLMPPPRPPRAAAPPHPPPPSAPAASSSVDIDFARIVAILLVVVAAGVLIWLIARLFRLHQQDPVRAGVPAVPDSELQLSVPPGELSANTYQTRAVQFAEDGNFAAAIRELLLGSMSWIERAGLIRFRRGLTSRDYVRAVWNQQDRRSAYLVTGATFDLVFFGRRTATCEMFEQCLAAFQGAFHEDASTERRSG